MCSEASERLLVAVCCGALGVCAEPLCLPSPLPPSYSALTAAFIKGQKTRGTQAELCAREWMLKGAFRLEPIVPVRCADDDGDENGP
jgi:hypothetical protein